MSQSFPPKLHLWILLFGEPNYSGDVLYLSQGDSLTSSFSIWTPFIAFSYLTALIRTCLSVSNRSDKMAITVFFQFQWFPIWDVSCGFCQNYVFMLLILYLICWVFAKGYWFLSNSFPASIKIITLWFCHYSLDMVTHIYMCWTIFALLNESHFTMMNHLFLLCN